MGLFGNKKEEYDVKTTSQIKDASFDDEDDMTPPTPAPVADLTMNQNNNSNEDLSNNFNQNNSNNFSYMPNGSSVNPTTNNLENQSSTPPTPEFNTVSFPNNNSNIQPTNMENSFSSINSNSDNEQNSNPLDVDVEQLVNETVEKVIDERWSDILEKIEKVVSWKEKQEAHINMIKEDIVSIKNGFELLEKRLMSKVGDYDRNILDVNSEIKAMEKVFQKITPTLVNNVNELSKITKNLKGEKEDYENNF